MLKKFLILGFALLFLSGCGAAGESADSAWQPEYDTVATRQSSDAESAETSEPEATSRLYLRTEPESDPDAKSPDADPAADTIPPETEPSSLHYLRLTRSTDSRYDGNGVELLRENRCNTEFYTDNPSEQDWIDAILTENQQEYQSNSQNLLKYAEEMITEIGPETFYSYSNYQEQGVVRHDSRVVSLISLSHLYSGGAHPNAVQTADNLDLRNHRALRLEDVVYESGVQKLESIIQDSVKQKFDAIGVEALYDDYPTTIQNSMRYGEMTPYWYFSHTGLVVFYNQYALGPYAAGIIKIEMPYEDLGGILREEFLPVRSEKLCSGDLLVQSDAQDRRQIPLEIGPDREQIVIGTEGLVYEVQISEIFWLDETPVTQQMLISINQMTDQDVLVMTGGFTDPERSFAVEFSDGCGQRHTYYIHPGELTENP